MKVFLDTQASVQAFVESTVLSLCRLGGHMLAPVLCGWMLIDMWKIATLSVKMSVMKRKVLESGDFVGLF